MGECTSVTEGVMLAAAAEVHLRDRQALAKQMAAALCKKLQAVQPDACIVQILQYHMKVWSC